MKKHRGVTTILLARSNHGKCAIYEHEGKYYITDKVGKSHKPQLINGKYYSEVSVNIMGGNEYWSTL